MSKSKDAIYLIEGGDKKTGLWFLPQYFNYRRDAVSVRDQHYPTLRVVKFLKAKP